MSSGLSGDQRVAIVECIENYIGDWACPDPYDAADFIAARVLEITRAPSDAALVEALEETATYLEALSDNHLRNDVDMLLDDCEDPRAIAEKLRAALAAAKGQP